MSGDGSVNSGGVNYLQVMRFDTAEEDTFTGAEIVAGDDGFSSAFIRSRSGLYAIDNGRFHCRVDVSAGVLDIVCIIIPCDFIFFVGIR